jgi:hypothetical protein
MLMICQPLYVVKIYIYISNLFIIAQNLSLRGYSLNLKISKEKTELVHLFHHTSSIRPRASDLPSLPVLETSALPTYLTGSPADHIKILGATIDASITFSPHIANAASSGMQALGAFRFLRKISLGITPKPERYLTISAILPRMVYGSEIWWLGNTSAMDPIRIFYNRIARWITDLPGNTRITKLLTCANLPPRRLSKLYINLLWYSPPFHFYWKSCNNSNNSYPENHKISRNR